MADNKPATVPTWATDTNFSSGPKSGSPTKVMPSGGALAQGEVPGQPYRGERKNWLWNLLCAWAFYLSDLHNQLQFLNKAYVWSGIHTFASNIVLAGATTITRATSPTFFTTVSLHNAVCPDDATGIQFDANGSIKLKAAARAAGYAARIPFKVPVGAQVTAVNATIFNGGASYSTSMSGLVKLSGANGTVPGTFGGGSGTMPALGGSQVCTISPWSVSTPADDRTEMWVDIILDPSNVAVQTIDMVVVTWKPSALREQLGA